MMFKMIKWPIVKLLDYYDLNALRSLRKSALNNDGWFQSYRLKVPVDIYCNPLPWVTYPFIDFIQNRLNKDMCIYEFGSGNSTLFYASRVKNITSVEHDIGWFNTIIDKMPINAKIILASLDDGDNYDMSAINSNTLYDIIIVDGRERIKCINNSVQALKHDGVLVLDDSEREKYTEGKQYLRDIGYKELAFWGIAPGLNYKKCTSIFYKQNNCLGL